MAAARNLDVDPYRADEMRVVGYLLEIAPDVGAGDDPIGFLIASHSAMRTGRPACPAETPLRNTDLPVIEEPRVPRRAPLDGDPTRPANGERLPPGRYHP
ncbi:hypothetical protein LNAOJCKE_3020 [Methylorubrum aminovorans]|uniref:Uncharacterized protein n=1 Tax=Methylorubrum aminovorans TaxID=269069 RepID=A0ABQ4UFA9_9HYPH|nr:hypothetical protein [Methylorubrum aminovorans]GJE65807.1 hypothetical protein LNAOJCKE_3020 [Methylorubrum aminovorans]GMA75839.1 hypothetical protein GCM10025880_22560 [Methylorubrum aminovorans]